MPTIGTSFIEGKSYLKQGGLIMSHVLPVDLLMSLLHQAPTKNFVTSSSKVPILATSPTGHSAIPLQLTNEKV